MQTHTESTLTHLHTIEAVYTTLATIAAGKVQRAATAGQLQRARAELALVTAKLADTRQLLDQRK